MSEDLILVPRRYVASACHALANGKNADNTVAGLREYSLGKSVEADAQSQLAALREELAQRNSFEELYSAAIDERDAIQQRLADAQRRNADAVRLLTALYDATNVVWPDVADFLAALNPNPEAASHDE